MRFCKNCDASLTETDLEIGVCTQCGSEVEGEDDDDRAILPKS